MMGNLYKFGSQGLKGVGKSDFNAMRTPLGAGVAGLSGMKVDALAGKKIGGAEGARKIAAKRAAENAEFFNVGKDEKREREEKGINAELRSNPELAQRHAEASHAADSHEAEHKDAAAKHKEAQEELLKAVAALERARGGDADAAAAAETAVSKSQANLETQANRIKKATQHLGLAKQVVKNIEDEAKSRAVASGNLKDFKNEGEIAATLAKSRFTSAFFTEAENKKIAEMARKEVGEHHEKKEAKKVLEYLKEKGGDDHEHGHDTPKPGSSPKPAAAAAHDEHKAAGGGHDDHKPH